MATLLEQVEVDTELRPAIAGRNPWALAARRLWGRAPRLESV